MVTTVLSILLAITMIVTVLLIGYILLRCKGDRRWFLLALLVGVFFYALGYLLEITANSADGAFTGVKVMYFGAAYIPPLLFLFTARYCGIKINKILSAIIMIIPVIIICLVWTADRHDLFYISYTLNSDTLVVGLEKVRGPLNTVGHIVGIFYYVGTVFILIRSYIIKTGETQIPVLITISVIIAVILNFIYIPFLDIYKINYGPFVAFLYVLIFGYCIIKYDIFDIDLLCAETILASMKEAFILADNQNRFIKANKYAEELFPGIAGIQKYTHLIEIKNWPNEFIFDDEIKDFFLPQITMPNDRFYSATISPIITEKKDLLGYVIMAQDVTGYIKLTKSLTG